MMNDMIKTAHRTGKIHKQVSRFAMIKCSMIERKRREKQTNQAVYFSLIKAF